MQFYLNTKHGQNQLKRKNFSKKKKGKMNNSCTCKNGYGSSAVVVKLVVPRAYLGHVNLHKLTLDGATVV